jgi:enoyl-CoA hydratase/carnithine racemase
MELVRTEDRGAVRHVVLNRPEKRNAMNQALLTELADALRAAEADGDVRCVVLRGEGPVFSAGVDLAELASFSAEDAGDPRAVLRTFRRVFLDAANLCEEIPKPVVCQIHGACVGGALEVALGCDLRVMAQDAKVGLPEVRFGLIPDVGGCSRLPAVVGLGRAKELVMTGKMIDAREAERIGLANRVVAADELEQATQALVDELLANSPVAVGLAKRVMDASAKPALAVTLEHEITAQEMCVAALREQARRPAEPAAAG